VAGVDRWPEDEAHGEIDGIVGPYAIQHTSIDSLPDGRFADQKFMAVIGDLERELAGKLGFHCRLFGIGPRFRRVRSGPRCARPSEIGWRRYLRRFQMGVTR
jgi:hypothetical protein